MSGTDAISLPELLRPSERSRLALAATASAILFGVIGIVASRRSASPSWRPP